MYKEENLEYGNITQTFKLIKGEWMIIGIDIDRPINHTVVHTDYIDDPREWHVYYTA
jgi:hypothetical protein